MADDRPKRDTPRSILGAVTASAQSAVIPVLPDDQLDAVAERVRQSGAAQVQLLIPSGAAVFRSPRSFLALRALLADRPGQLLVISGDAETIAAAQRAGIETLGVDAAALTPPGAGRAAGQPIDERDAAFLRDLDQVGSHDSAVDALVSDPDLSASLEDLYGEDLEATRAAEPPTSDEDFTAELERLSRSSRAAPAPRRPPPEEAMRRLSGEAPAGTRPRRRARSSEAADAAAVERPEVPSARRPGRQRARSGGALAGDVLPRGVRSRPAPIDEDEYAPAARRRSISPTLVALLAIGVLLAAALAWALANRVTVVITPPAGEVREIAFDDEVIPLDQSMSAQSATAVQAVTVSADAEYVLTSQVVEETVSPVGRAAGQVRIINTIEQAVPLPEGTEFVGENAEGAEVRFVLDEPVTVPPAVTTATESGRTTTYGETIVSVTARSPGSASNVEANAIKQVIIPGQPPIVSDRSNFLIRHEAIGGGSEAPQRIVTEAEVQRVLGDALTNLYNEGLRRLQEQAGAQGLAIDPTTMMPSIAELAQPESYEPPVVNPPVGSAVDPANPVFTVTVRTRFTGLATPPDRPVAKQLETVVPQHFSQRSNPPCLSGESQSVQNVSWSWNGQRLAIDGVVACTPRGEVPPDTIVKVRAALVGASREAAIASLQEYERQRLIGGFQLPDRPEMPPFEFLIDVQVQQPGAAPQAEAGTLSS